MSSLSILAMTYQGEEYYHHFIDGGKWDSELLRQFSCITQLMSDEHLVCLTPNLHSFSYTCYPTIASEEPSWLAARSREAGLGLPPLSSVKWDDNDGTPFLGLLGESSEVYTWKVLNIWHLESAIYIFMILTPPVECAPCMGEGQGVYCVLSTS